METYPHTRDIHIENIRPGDAVVHNGEVVTVSTKNIRFDSFMGTTVFGDSYHGNHKLVTKVFYNKRS